MKRFATLTGTGDHPAMIDPNEVMMIAEGRMEDEPGLVCHVVLRGGVTIILKGSAKEVYDTFAQATRLN
jgi:ribosomal protein S12